MLTGTLIKLVHLSHCVLNTRLVPDHNDKGYGVIEDADGCQVYFSHEAVENQFGFDLLREGQRLDYIMENGPFLRAVSVRQNSVPADVQPVQGSQKE
jgi:cold shock CspA family protein